MGVQVLFSSVCSSVWYWNFWQFNSLLPANNCNSPQSLLLWPALEMEKQLFLAQKRSIFFSTLVLCLTVSKTKIWSRSIQVFYDKHSIIIYGTNKQTEINKVNSSSICVWKTKVHVQGLVVPYCPHFFLFLFHLT